MTIKIELDDKHLYSELLEKLEDKIRDLLKKELKNGFMIEDDYIGNSLSPYGGEDLEKENV